MMRRCVFGVAIAILIAGSVVLVQAQGRVIQNRQTLDPVVGDVFVDCAALDVGNFKVLTDWTATLDDTFLLGKDGQIKQAIRKLKFTSDVYYNSEKPWNSLDGGPGEGFEYRAVFENGIPATLAESGDLVKIIVPGYGPIYSAKGRAMFEWDPTTNDWAWGHVIFNSGPTPTVQDKVALCNALM
jgi:hypothetical protein